MLTHLIEFSTEINGKRYKFIVENQSTTPDCKKALFQFVGEIDKLEHDQKQSEQISEEVQIEPIHEEA